MAGKPLYDLYNERDLNQKFFVVDTSFILNARSNASDTFSKSNAKLLKHLLAAGAKLVYNVSIRSELLKIIRELLLNSFIQSEEKKENLCPELQSILDANQSSPKTVLLKLVADSGYGLIFRDALGMAGEKLTEEFEKYTSRMTFHTSQDLRRESNDADFTVPWSHVFQIMAQYGLNSSDAMIMNFAISSKIYSGLITADKDFRYCADESIQDFHIFMPEKFLNLSTNKKWSKEFE